jgi:hypothetical protein
MSSGRIKLTFEDGDKFNTFHEMIVLLREAGILPDDFDWDWDFKDGVFEAVLFSRTEAQLQKGGQADVSSRPDGIVSMEVGSNGRKKV